MLFFYLLQNITFPKNPELDSNPKLFYLSGKPLFSGENAFAFLAPFQRYDFVSFLNSFSLKKWMQYTDLKTVSLSIKAKGHFILRLTSYYRETELVVKKCLVEKEYQLDTEQEILLEYPATNDTLLAFELDTLSDCQLFSAGYLGAFSDVPKKNVELSIVTTTFKKEAFIRRNVLKLKEELLSDPDIGSHVQVYVIDNGRSLDVGEFQHSNIHVCPNKNVGGSGGFARGMLEVLHQESPATHILLMDDAVLLLPDSIRRTYQLLMHLKPEYQDHFISGAMLDYERKNLLHEDIGHVYSDGSYRPLKPERDMAYLLHVCMNEETPYYRKHQYAAWWYCCFPVEVVKKNGLPLPLFVRGDDVEFGLRNQAKIITMNGICVWHMGFRYKFSGSMELYQTFRNSLIYQAISGVCSDIDFMPRIWRTYRSRMLALDYNGAEQVLDAVEDFLKGPDFIAQPNGEVIMKQQGQKNERLSSLTEGLDRLAEIPAYDGELFFAPPRNPLHTFLYRLTYNGHRLCPQTLLSDKIEVVPYDWYYSPEKFFWKKSLLAVNPFTRQGVLRTLDKARYKKLQKRYAQIMAEYKKMGATVRQQYRNQFGFFSSEEFWKKYLFG